MTASESKMNGARMGDKEMLDWVEKNVFKIRLQLNDTYLVDYYEGDGTQQESTGTSLRDCIQKANTVKISEGEEYFLHNGISMKAVPCLMGRCGGCDMWQYECSLVNDSLEATHGFRCGTSHQIMFVHSKDKEEYED